jgi:hypothetical protein
MKFVIFMGLGLILSGCQPSPPKPLDPVVEAKDVAYLKSAMNAPIDKKSQKPWDGKGADPNFPIH